MTQFVGRFAIGAALLCAGFLAGFWASTARLTPRMQQRQASIDSLAGVAGELRQLVALGTVKLDTVEIPRWRVLRDSAHTILPGTPDSGLVGRALGVADSVITSCRRVLTDCERLAATERERGDSLEAQVRDALRRPRFTWNLYGATDTRGGLYGGIEARVRVVGVEAFGRYEQRVDSTASALRVGAILRF